MRREFLLRKLPDFYVMYHGKWLNMALVVALEDAQEIKRDGQRTKNPKLILFGRKSGLVKRSPACQTPRGKLYLRGCDEECCQLMRLRCMCFCS
jgi:hypothetical protein